MTPEELAHLAVEAARDLVTRGGRPVPAAVVLPQPHATKVLTLPDFPDDDVDRERALAAFAADVMRPVNAPAFVFVAEALAADETGDPVDVLVASWGARGRVPRLAAAPLTDDGLGDFTPDEELAPGALPFLAPLQRAVDSAAPPPGGGDAPGGPGPLEPPGGGLPVIG